MKTHEYWRDTATHEVWAVELTDGLVTGCRGPLRPSEIDPRFIAGNDYSADGSERIEARREQFDLLSGEELLLLSAEND